MLDFSKVNQMNLMCAIEVILQAPYCF